jgi:hypothetical protein
MAIYVRISEPTLLPALIESFLRNHCVAQRIDNDTCAVVHVHARDAREASQEVAFFLRAWQAQHPDVSVMRAV